MSFFFSFIAEPDEAFDGPDSGYDIVVDDDAINTQYGHDSPQIHQVQHIANVETLQQFSPAYPVSPIYRPVVYNHGPSSNPFFKQNDEAAVTTAANITNDEIKSTSTAESKIQPVKSSVDTKFEPGKPIDEIEKSVNTLNTEQTTKVEQLEKVSTILEAKLELAATTKLPAPMDQVLAVNTTATTT